MTTLTQVMAQKNLSIVEEFMDSESLCERFNEIEGVDIDATSDDLTRIVFVDGSYIWINLQFRTIELG